MKRLHSRDNPQYRRIAALASSARERRDQDRILLDGAHLIVAYLDAFGPQDLSLLVRDDALERPEIAALRARLGDGAILQLAQRLFDALSPVDSPVGVMAVAPLPEPAAGSHGEGFALLLDGIQDPGNLGAILRSAAAAGAGAVYLSVACADPWSPRCLRGGMGAQFLLALHERQSLPQVAQHFEGAVIAATIDGDRSLFELKLDGPCAFIVGAEGQGISPELLAHAGTRVRIPMIRGIESLNAAAAATLLFYEWMRCNRAGRSRA